MKEYYKVIESIFLGDIEYLKNPENIRTNPDWVLRCYQHHVQLPPDLQDKHLDILTDSEQQWLSAIRKTHSTEETLSAKHISILNVIEAEKDAEELDPIYSLDPPVELSVTSEITFAEFTHDEQSDFKEIHQSALGIHSISDWLLEQFSDHSFDGYENYKANHPLGNNNIRTQDKCLIIRSISLIKL